MPVTISVSQVRRALYQAAGAAGAHGDGSPSTPVLGKWFHEGVGLLVGNRSPASPLARLAELDADLDLWKQSLVAEAYSQFVGPRLTREQAALHDEAPQVVAFWQAMQAACHWLAELSWSRRSERPSRRGTQPGPWQTLADCMSTEEPLMCVLREPGWSDSVRLVGIADAIVRLAPAGVWCAIEFKLGQTSPEADLGQACLYHLMLSATTAVSLPHESRAQVIPESGTLALISFRPDRHERLFTASDLESAKTRLIDLIGRLAGVDLSPAGSTSAASGPFDNSRLTVKPEARTRGDCGPTEQHLELGRGLVATLAEYGVDVSLGQPVSAGPTFLRFPIELGPGTKVRKVQGFASELQVRLQLRESPFIRVDDGRIVIDVQRPDRQTVWFDDVRSELRRSDGLPGGSRVPVGVDLFRRLVCADLAKPEHAHLLVAGTTGSGKSEWLRLAVAGLIATNTPETLRLLVIDPKRNAFHALRESPFLWKPLVFPDEMSAAAVLHELAEEMDRRYRMFDGADSFQQLAEKSKAALPRIVCVCDEYRDLISRSRGERKRIEEQICRLGAKARAAGIHLILATQEPSRETIRGALDSNIPARVGLKMGKSIESTMLLNEPGAEKLLGHGDLLFKDVGDPCRLQAPLLTEANRLALFGRANSTGRDRT
ncbi:MAG: DNA translocase FtsK [Deltaproteobacteria bacterium]